jgi:para-aminobenzoate synthetase component 1
MNTSIKKTTEKSMKSELAIAEIPFQNPLEVFEPFATQPYTLLFDSALKHADQGRYAFIAIDPFLTLVSKDGKIKLSGESFQGDPFNILQDLLQKYHLEPNPELPPFQTGAAGYFGYDLGQHLEKLPRPRMDDIKFPDMALGFYDVVLAFDLFQSRSWIVSSGFPESDAEKRLKKAEERIEWMKSQIAQAHPTGQPQPLPNLNTKSNFTQAGYEKAVQRVIDYIYAGDIFQANISQRFMTPLPEAYNKFQLYKNLRNASPVSFGAYLNFGSTTILSSSPERFIQLSGNKVKTRPIKGTRPRGLNPEADAAIADELIHSEKDRAENVMIVDLLRNDLSRVCKDHSVQTPEICAIESFATVHHLVSTVVGELRDNLDAVDLLRASFPGGSITGAPKIRAMEIISELEPTQRGPYCGSIGYISFNGDMDTNIVIRTITMQDNQLTFQVGGGIVADSDPQAEYEETLTKAQAIFDALIPQAQSATLELETL